MHIYCKQKFKPPFTKKKLGQTNNAKIIAEILGLRRSALSLDIVSLDLQAEQVSRQNISNINTLCMASSARKLNLNLRQETRNIFLTYIHTSQIYKKDN